MNKNQKDPRLEKMKGIYWQQTLLLVDLDPLKLTTKMQISSFKMKVLHFHSNYLLVQLPGDNYAFNTPHHFHDGWGTDSDEWVLFALWLLLGA